MGIRRFNDPNTGRWAPVLTHVSAVIGMNGKNLKTILEELQAKADSGGRIQDGSDIALSEMEQGKMYTKDGKIYICISHDDSTSSYELLSIGEDGIHQVGYNTTDGTYNNVLVGPDSNKMLLAPTGFSTMTPAQVISWAGSATKGILYDKDTKAIWWYNISGTLVSEVCFGGGTVERREGMSGSSFGAWWDFRGVPIVYVQDTTATLSPNTYYVFNGTPASLTITFNEPLTSTYLCEYMFEFTSGSSGDIQISLPSGVQWYEIPEIEANKKYQVSISRGIGLIVGVDVV